MRLAATALIFALANPVGAADIPNILAGITTSFSAFKTQTEALDATACDDVEALRKGYHKVFDAWNTISHLRFGPMEEDERAYAMAFWPDTRGFTPKSLNGLVAAEDPVVNDRTEFAEVSIAARGLFALEQLLYEPSFAQAGTPAYRCALIDAITGDMARIAGDLVIDWPAFAEGMLNPAPGTDFATDEDVLRALFTALSTGLEFNADARLGRPLGTFDRPRPRRAEARRSGRSLLNVQQAIDALAALALQLSDPDPALEAAIARAKGVAAELNDPVFAGVSDPSGRNKVEILQQSINLIQEAVALNLGPQLGVAAGFNALDGD